MRHAALLGPQERTFQFDWVDGAVQAFAIIEPSIGFFMEPAQAGDASDEELHGGAAWPGALACFEVLPSFRKPLIGQSLLGGTEMLLGDDVGI
jgi:hypothetical protein